MVTGLPYLERVARIELANKPWQGFRLPLHHTRIILFTIFVWSAGSDLNRRCYSFAGCCVGPLRHRHTNLAYLQGLEP